MKKLFSNVQHLLGLQMEGAAETRQSGGGALGLNTIDFSNVTWLGMHDSLHPFSQSDRTIHPY